jgi:hypothetical protein
VGGPLLERFVCVHGHFYQPPRENPWLEAVELEDSAYPYHDWNERITAECYAPNAASRILEHGEIVDIVNNYARMSFNFGPTLLAWLMARASAVYLAILDADRLSRRRFGGHGSAMAQAYNHMILPLANEHDRHTQVVWGVRDFESRFRRRPEGMWLPETAVDLASLDELAGAGIAFTVLSPYQAARVRSPGEAEWRDVGPEGVDPGRPYRVALPGGRSIAVFFYEGAVAQEVAFGGLLQDGERFARRLEDLPPWGPDSALVNVATDGETYGHHQRHGDMALAYALDRIARGGRAALTNYGEHLERAGATWEAEIRPYTSWSCAHGVERWRSDCGCRTGPAHWHQAWRAPLRRALDLLRDRVAAPYEERAGVLLTDPWAARDGYIDVVLDRSGPSLDRYFERYARRALTAAERVEALKLLEMQRHAMLMYTSCGWFFDDISGLEAVQVLRYAGRVLQLARQSLGIDVEEEFLAVLAEATSNLPERGDGRQVFEAAVRPAMVDLGQVGAHVSITDLFQADPSAAANGQAGHAQNGHGRHVYCYRVKRPSAELLRAGQARLAVGRLRVDSEITLESADLIYGVAHWGDHNVVGAVRPYEDDGQFAAVREALAAPFRQADLPGVVRAIDRAFDGKTYSIRELFRDEQRLVLGEVLRSTLGEVEAAYGQIYEHHAALMRFLSQSGVPLPKAFLPAADFVLGQRLEHAFAARPLDVPAIEALLVEAGGWGLGLDQAGLAYTFEKTLADLAARLSQSPYDVDLLAEVEEASRLATTLPFRPDLGALQDVYHQLLRTLAASPAGPADEAARIWRERFLALGRWLGVRVAS